MKNTMMKNRKHGSEPNLRRQAPNRAKKQIIAILTEGKTEQEYIQHLVKRVEAI